MDHPVQDFIQEIETSLKPLYLAYTHASWEAATTGAEEANQREKDAQAALMRFWADPHRFATAKRLHEEKAAKSPLDARQIELIYLSSAKAQQDEGTIEKLTELEAKVRQAYYNFRAKIDGKQLTDNELDHILQKSHDSQEVRKAWEATKQIGAQVADPIRELARLRNQAARRQGYRDHFQKSLLLNEIDEVYLMALFDELDAVTRPLFVELKREIDQARAKWFGISVEDLRPWHFGDRFFQSPPQLQEIDLDQLFEDHNPVALAKATYDSFGLEVGDILERSDLYARPGKDQHAFCIDMDHKGDVRTLNNLEPNFRWNSTLLHELGHAIYDKTIDLGLPWLLRRPAHSLTTEAVAILMGSLINSEQWLLQILGLPLQQAESIAQITQKRSRASRLIFTRWCLVMTNFERAFYADPEQDLDALWWDMVERYQMLSRPSEWENPDWAAKYHIALYPVYYQNYELGELMTAQLERLLKREFGGLVGRPEAGRWLAERVLRPGAVERWSEHIESAAGEPLSTRYFVESIK